MEIRPGGVDFPSVQMVASGSEDFGITGADQILLSREKGVPVVALSVIYRDTPFVLVTLKNSGITSLKDLVGKKVGIKLGGNEELTYRAMLKSAGIAPGQIEEMPVKYDMSPLFSKQVMAWPGYVINESIAAKEQGYDVNVIKPQDYGINLYADTLFTRQDIIDKDPEMVKAFTQATMKGWSYAVENPDEAAAYGSKYGQQLKLEHEKAMMQSSISLLRPADKPLGKMDEKSWSDLQDQLISLGFMKQKQDISKVFTNKFLQ